MQGSIYSYKLLLALVRVTPVWILRVFSPFVTRKTQFDGMLMVSIQRGRCINVLVDVAEWSTVGWERKE